MGVTESYRLVAIVEVDLPGRYCSLKEAKFNKDLMEKSIGRQVMIIDKKGAQVE